MRTLKDKVQGRGRGTGCHRGFTLMELIIVMAIIGMLAGLTVPTLRTARIRAREAKARATIASLQIALSMYNTDFGVYPQSNHHLFGPGHFRSQRNSNSFAPRYPAHPFHRTLVAHLDGYMDFKEGEIAESPHTPPRRVLLDPWGRAYVYVSRRRDDHFVPAEQAPFHPDTVNLENNTFNLFSLGADGRTHGGVSFEDLGGDDWDLSTMYDNWQDGHRGDVADGPRFDDINSWE